MEKPVTSRRAEIFYLGLLAVGWLASLAIGLAGIDFGPHWDEPNTIDEVTRAVRTGVLLPRWYNYPDFTFDLAVAGLAPSALRSLVAHGFDLRETARELLSYVDSDAYHLRLRFVFFVFVELCSLGVVGALLALGYRVREAVLCGLLLLSSWQVAYHARWIAPDDLMMAATALFIPASVAACRRPRAVLWGKSAAVLLGLVISCKYPGGLLLVAFLPCFYVRLRYRDGWRRGPAIRAVAACLAITTAAFLALTPGAYVEPLRFLRDIDAERLHYTVLGHGAHTIEAIWPRFLTIVHFLLVSCLSPYAPVAWCLAVLVPLGAVRLFRRDRLIFAVVVGPAILGVLYFSSVKVVFVRNYLFIFPYVAVIATAGVAAVVDRMPSKAARSSALTLLLLSVAGNFAYGATAAAAIRNRASIEFAASLKAYLENHPGEHIYVAPSALHLAGQSASDLPGAAPTLPSSDHVIYDSDQFDWDHQYRNLSAHNLSNRPNVYTLIAGSREVDWDYYPDWLGDHRLMMVETKDYEQLAAY